MLENVEKKKFYEYSWASVHVQPFSKISPFQYILFFSKLLICIYTQQRKMLNTHTHILNEYKPEEYECKLLTIQ
jgi:hypothetical protein